MGAKQTAAMGSDSMTTEELAAAAQLLASIPNIDLYQKKIHCSASGFGNKGHVLIRNLSDNNVAGPPIAFIDVDAESCDVLLKALWSMRRQLKILAAYQASKKQ